MQKAKIYCTGQIEGGTSFAVREDTGDSVFIPAAIAKMVRMEIGSGHMANLIVNARHPDRTPWFATFVGPADAHNPEDPYNPEDVLLERVEHLLGESRGYFTTEEVAEACDADPVEAQGRLERLFAGGLIRRAAVQKVPNGDTELTLWARHLSDFLPEDE